MATYKDDWTKVIDGMEISFSYVGDLPLSDVDKRVANMNAADGLKKGLTRDMYNSFAANQNIAWEVKQ